MTAGWGMALRLARREGRRRPGRTVLVALLVGLPVAALAITVVLMRTNTLTAEEWRQADRARADEVFEVGLPQVIGPAAEAIRAAAPAGTRVVGVAEYVDAAPGPDGRLVQLMTSDEPLEDPLVAGRHEVLEGRAPSGPHEIALTPQHRRDLGVGVGDEIDLLRAGRVKVTGVVASPAYEWVPSVIGRAYAPRPVRAVNTTMNLLYVDLPDGAGPDALRSVPGWLNRHEPFDGGNQRESDRTHIRGGYAIGGLGLLLTGTVAAAAFAVGSRRHLRTLGLLAASGVPPAGLRRVMLLQGVVTGAAGSLGGLAVALAVTRAAEQYLDTWASRAVGPLDVRPLDMALVVAMGVLAATLAAWWPARTAARIPVLSALAGRRPQRAVHPSVPVLGLILAAAGVAVVAAYALGVRRDDRNGGVGVAGAALVILGGTLSTPWIVARLEPLAARARGGLRVAARGLARNRLRTCAVATAVMAPAAVAMFAVTVGLSNQGPQFHNVRTDQVLVQATSESGVAPVDEQVLDRVRAAVPGAHEATLRLVAEPRDAGAPYMVTSEEPEDVYQSASVAVGTPALLDALGLPPAAGRHLAAGRVVGFGDIPGDLVARHAGVAGTGGEVVFTRRDVRVVQAGERRPVSLPTFLVPERWPAAHGLRTVDGGVLLRAPEPLEGRARAALERAGDVAETDAYVRHVVLGTPEPEGGAVILFEHPERRNWGGIGGAGVGMLVFTLLVVAVALALNAAETREEGALLAALGAPPRVRRSVTGWQATLLPLTGMLVGVPLGLASAVAMTLCVPVEERTGGLVVPWALMAVLLVGVPLVSGLAARIVAAIGGRRRPALAATLALD